MNKNKPAPLAPDRRRLTVAGFNALKIADSTSAKSVEVAIAVYTNLNVYTLSVTVEDGEEFVLVNSSSQLSAEERENFLLFTGQRTVDIVGGLDVHVELTGVSGSGTDPQGRAWVITKADGRTFGPEKLACGSSGQINRSYLYDV
jgi:hypothetical protein